MTACHVAVLTAHYVQVAANDWYEVVEVAANDWYEVAEVAGRLANGSVTRVAANDWHEVAEVAANDWYEVAEMAGRLANRSVTRLIRQNCQFHGFRNEDANEHLNKYLSITQFIKKNGVSEDIINLNLFPFSLTHEAEIWYYHLKTHSIHTWEEMVSKFLSKYYPYSKALHLRKEILNFRQLPAESVFEAWERFKSCLRKCPDHRILLVDQILKFYHGITMIDQEKIMMAAGGNIMRPCHPNTVEYTYSDESDEDEPSEADKSEIDPLIRESTDTFLMGDEEIELNSHKDIDDLVPIPRVSEKPLDSCDPISKTFDMTITNPLFDFDFEFTLNSDNPIFDIQNEESDESETETIMKEVHSYEFY
ncbi:reverse transcriptase domain-containing protein [Tanacetum coccineum]